MKMKDHYERANVLINAPLALIQVDLNAQMNAYKKVLFMLQKIKESEVQDV